jgi:hypothetical protein
MKLTAILAAPSCTAAASASAASTNALQSSKQTRYGVLCLLIAEMLVMAGVCIEVWTYRFA